MKAEEDRRIGILIKKMALVKYVWQQNENKIVGGYGCEGKGIFW